MRITALNFFRWLTGKPGQRADPVEVSCRELLEAAQDYQLREMSFWICVNMIANALGRCEFRTFQGNREVRDREYYMWNVSPNVNQNSSAFLHKLVARLYQDNEALIVNALPRDGMESLVVADSWQTPEEYPSRQNEYRGVTVGDFQFQYPLYENQVLHLKLNHINMRPVIAGLYQSYYRLVETAMKAYQWNGGQHWKVHVSQLAQGGDGWEESFQKMISAQMKPFLESNGAVLPEFDGYAYTRESGGQPGDTRDIRALMEDIFDFTARGFLIPAVLVNGSVEGTADANTRFLTNCVDPLADQLQEEGNRKRYTLEEWRRGDFMQVDTSSIIHFDMFANAANVEKLVGSGAFTINDVRRAAGEPMIPEDWANSFFMTKNISSMDALTRPMEEGGTT